MILYCCESKLEDKKLKTLLSVHDTYLCTGWSRLWPRSETAPTKKAPPVGDILGLCRAEPRQWRNSGRDAIIYPGRYRPPPRLNLFAPLRPNTAAPILRTNVRVRVPESPGLRLSSSPPFTPLKPSGKITTLVCRLINYLAMRINVR